MKPKSVSIIWVIGSGDYGGWQVPRSADLALWRLRRADVAPVLKASRLKPQKKLIFQLESSDRKRHKTKPPKHCPSLKAVRREESFLPWRRIRPFVLFRPPTRDEAPPPHIREVNSALLSQLIQMLISFRKTNKQCLIKYLGTLWTGQVDR